MAIPDYQTCMLPALRVAGDGKAHVSRDIAERLSKEFNLAPDERVKTLPSGAQFVFNSNVNWAITYMFMAGLLTRPKRGVIQITKRGQEVLASNPNPLNRKYLLRFPEFTKFVERAKPNEETVPSVRIQSESSPEILIDEAYGDLKQTVAAEILDQIKKCSPVFFERLVIELGYGGSLKDAGEAIGKSGDGGIDGFIKEDRLGLDQIYVQAKRWEGNVGRPQLQAFVGALHGRGNKGVFITTSAFTKDAEDYAKGLNAPTKVILIYGEQLADLMIEHNLGVSVRKTYEIKKIDFDYFTEEE